jgi:periplasmic copper chaperone A
MKKLILLAVLVAAPVSAHVVFSPGRATAGSYHAGVLRVGHGCGTEATTAIRVEIPEGITVARAQPKPGWTIEVEQAALAAPIVADGKTLTARVASITWRGELAADQFDDFGLMLKLPPERTGPLALPVVQHCGNSEVRWDQVPVEGQAHGASPHPAPILDVSASDARGH